MRVHVKANQNDPSRVLSFVAFESRKFGRVSIPAYFNEGDQPPLGDFEVMITGILFHKRPSGSFNLTRPPKCLFIRRPTSDDLFISFDGFRKQRADDRAIFTASNARDEENNQSMVTPGRLQEFLVIADLNAAEITPGIGWAQINPDNGVLRLEGIDSMKETWI